MANNQTKQVELLKAADVPVKKIFFYDGLPQYRFEGGLQTAPEFGSDWHETARESQVAANGLPFSFVTLERR